MSLAIGIDLGTTYSCVAAAVDDEVEVIANFEGFRTTPSCVAYTDEEVLVGNSAVAQAQVNPANTIFDVKRIMGMLYDNETVQKDIQHWPFKVVAMPNGQAAVEVDYKGQKYQKRPEQISAEILRTMKETAERFLQAKVDKAVVTVPAYFNDGQRRATFDAATIAGLKVLQIINEPTAASLAHCVQRPSDSPRKVLVFDLGGGTLDITILDIKGKHVKVIATKGNSHLGGEDFVMALMDHCVREFEELNDVEVPRTPEMLQGLHDECERVKTALSEEDNMAETVEVVEFFDDINLDVFVLRSKFEALCEPMFKEAISLVEDILDDAELLRREIDEVLLVGGSTRIPRLQELLSEFFGGKDLSKTLPPDHAVAYGAAVQAAALSGNKKFVAVSLSDVIPLSIGVRCATGEMSVFAKRNSRIPLSASLVGTTAKDNQTKIIYEIYEGEHELAEKNNLLGRFVLSGVKPALRGVPYLDETLSVDVNGILSVSVIDRETKSANGMKIEFNKGRLSEAEIQRMIREADQCREDESKVIERNRALCELEQYCATVKKELNCQTIGSKVVEKEARAVEANLARIAQQLAHKRATMEEIFACQKELTELWERVTAKLDDTPSTSAICARGLKRQFELDQLAKDINNMAAKMEHDENANKRIKTEENECDSDAE